jgi:hypothetical protein
MSHRHPVNMAFLIKLNSNRKHCFPVYLVLIVVFYEIVLIKDGSCVYLMTVTVLTNQNNLLEYYVRFLLCPRSFGKGIYP